MEALTLLSYYPPCIKVLTITSGFKGSITHRLSHNRPSSSFHITNTTGSQEKKQPKKQSCFSPESSSKSTDGGFNPQRLDRDLALFTSGTLDSHCRTSTRSSMKNTPPRQSAMAWGGTEGWALVSLCGSSPVRIPSDWNLLRFPCKQVPAHLQSIL